MISGVSHVFMRYNFSIKVQLRLSLDAHTQKHLSTDPMEEENLILILSNKRICSVLQFFFKLRPILPFERLLAIFPKRNSSYQESNLTMGHFDNIWCRYKRYYFGKTLKCEIKSCSLGCCRNVSVALAQPRWRWELLFKSHLNQFVNQMVEVKFKSSPEERKSRERHPCVHACLKSFSEHIGQFSCKANHNFKFF